MKSLVLCIGSSGFIKQKLWGYCFEHFAKEQFWIVDSLPIFDPYWVSRIDVARARQMLRSIRIARPFTFYQLRDKVFSLTRIRLPQTATIIVSCMNRFDRELGNQHEAIAIKTRVTSVLERLGCKVIIGELV